MEDNTTKIRLQEFNAKFATLVHNREKIPLSELRSTYAKAYMPW